MIRLILCTSGLSHNGRELRRCCREIARKGWEEMGFAASGLNQWETYLVGKVSRLSLGMCIRLMHLSVYPSGIPTYLVSRYKHPPKILHSPPRCHQSLHPFLTSPFLQISNTSPARQNTSTTMASQFYSLLVIVSWLLLRT